jgi:hypothetical protein
MNPEMKLVLITLIGVAGLMIFWPATKTAARPQNNPAAAVLTPGGITGAERATHPAAHRTLIDRKAILPHESMPLKERIRGQSADQKIKRDLYKHEKNLVWKKELENNERALANLRPETGRVRDWSPEDDRLLTLVEETAHEELHGSVKPAHITYDPGANWSLAGLEKISGFFHKRFGKPLPISARGQSETHDRLGLDHRDSVDIALRPDSPEGRGLIAYLRNNGVPFLAFPGKLSSMSTGAHIHIGRRSPFLKRVNQEVRTEPSRRERSAQG